MTRERAEEQADAFYADLRAYFSDRKDYRACSILASNRDVLCEKVKDLILATEAAVLEEVADIAGERASTWWADYKHGKHRADPHYQGMSDGAGEIEVMLREQAAQRRQA